MSTTQQEAQISVRVPRFVHARLERLRDEIVDATGEKKPSQPEVVAALVCAAKAVTLSQALKKYRREMAARVREDSNEAR
jgi:hypothetical protein